MNRFVCILCARTFSFIVYNALTRAALVAPPLSFTLSLKLSHKFSMAILQWLASGSLASVSLSVVSLSPRRRPSHFQAVIPSNSLRTITRFSFGSEIEINENPQQ